MDELLHKANRVADHTVFISYWLRDYFSEKWFDSTKPHSVIQNGADDAIFYPPKGDSPQVHSPIRLVTHHWSDNVLKGFDIYQELDSMIHAGKLPGFSFTVIGRWPASIVWKSATTFPPCNGTELADHLRNHDLYVTASRWEPCGMHHIEGAQCGLPLIYHPDGGGIVEFGERYGLPISADLKTSVEATAKRIPELREKLRKAPPSGTRMCSEFYAVLLGLLPTKTHI
jgi:glycosyltransferase involved in cell wall biosynthesis